MREDRSIIRLLTDFAAAKNEGDAQSVDPMLRYRGFIQFSPSEYYFQSTSIETGITLTDPTVTLVDCSGALVLDITDKVLITPFNDDDAAPQISYQIAPIITDLGNRPLYLKFRDDTSTWYSNSITVTDYDLNKTTRVDYKQIGYSDNLRINFTLAPYYNSVRIVGFFNDVEDESSVKQYTQMTTGNEISTDPLITERDLYKLEYSNNWNYRRVNRLMTCDVIYLNGVRCTNKPFMKKGERLGSSNIFVADFAASMNRDDVYSGGSQFPFLLLSRIPENGNYTLDQYTVLTDGRESQSLTFNKAIVADAGLSLTIFHDGVEMGSPVTSLVVAGNTVTFDMDGRLDDGFGEYEFVLNPALITSTFGDTWAGFGDDGWVINIVNGDWLEGDWNSSDWLV